MRALPVLFLCAALGAAEPVEPVEPDDDGAEAVVLELPLVLQRPRAVARVVPAALGADESALPGRAEPVDGAAAGAWRIAWSDYITLIVVDPGEGLRRRAWVATLSRDSGALQVAYGGTAFVDRQGDVHIDCRGVDEHQMRGALANQWSPDSFAIEADGDVRVMDDQNRSSKGSVDSQHPARGPDGELTQRYRRDRLLARYHVTGIL